MRPTHPIHHQALKGRNTLTQGNALGHHRTCATTEQKVPFEVISLVQAILDTGNEYSKAYLVLGGEGWKLRDFYTGGGLEKHLEYADKVDIVTLENFVAIANKGKL